MISFLIILDGVIGLNLLIYIFYMKSLKNRISSELDHILREKGFTNPSGTELIRKPSSYEKTEMMKEVISRSDNVPNKPLAIRMVKIYNSACILTGVFIALLVYIVFKIL